MLATLEEFFPDCLEIEAFRIYASTLGDTQDRVVITLHFADDNPSHIVPERCEAFIAHMRANGDNLEGCDFVLRFMCPNDPEPFERQESWR